MKKEVIANMDMSILPTIGLLLFLGVFIGVLIWSFRNGSTKLYEQVMDSALDEGTPLNKKGEL